MITAEHISDEQENTQFIHTNEPSVGENKLGPKQDRFPKVDGTMHQLDEVADQGPTTLIFRHGIVIHMTLMAKSAD